MYQQQEPEPPQEEPAQEYEEEEIEEQPVIVQPLVLYLLYIILITNRFVQLILFTVKFKFNRVCIERARKFFFYI